MTGIQQPSTVVLAVVVVTSTIAFAGAAAAAIDTVDRSIDSTTVEPGETTTVAVSVRVDSATSRLSIADRFAPSFEAATVQDVSFSGGSGSVVTQFAEPDGVDVAVKDLDAGTTVTVTYRVTVPEDAEGRSFAFDGWAVSGDQKLFATGDAVVTVPGDGPRNADEFDERLRSGGTFWRGQGLRFNASGIVSANASAEARTFQVRSVDDGEADRLVSTFTVDRTAARTIDTDDLDGEYVVVYQGTPVGVDADGEGRLRPGADVSDELWEVTSQSFSVHTETDDDEEASSFGTGEVVVFQMDSNRGSYTVNVSADDADEDDLARFFDHPGDDGDLVPASLDDEDDDESVQLRTTADGEIAAVFDDSGDYELDFTVHDTIAFDAVTVEVRERDVQVDFARSRFAQEEGDEVTITVTPRDTDEAWVFVGGERVNYLERLHVVDENGDGTVEITMNTWLAGRGEGPSEGAYEVEGEDDIEDVTRLSTGDRVSGGDLELEIAPALSGPLRAGGYTLRAASSGAIDTSGAVLTEQDVASLDLRERTTDGISTWVAPRDAVNGDDPETLLDNATRARTVALSDRLIVEVRASGLYGYLEDDEEDTLFQNGLALEIEGAGEVANRDPTSIAIRRGSGIELVTDPDEDAFYLVVDLWLAETRNGRDIDDGDTYEPTFYVFGDGSDIQEELGRIDANPYVEDEAQEAVTAPPVRVEAPAIEFDDLVDGELRVRSAPDASVSGTTNLAPMTELTVRLRAGGEDTFLTSRTVTVGPDGRWNATFDLSDVPTGVEFEASARKGDRAVADAPGRVVDRVDTPTAAPEVLTRTVVRERPSPTPRVVTYTVTPPTPSPRRVDVTRTVVRTTVVRETRIAVRTVRVTPTETPGLGVAAAIAALLAATALAVRRVDRP